MVECVKGFSPQFKLRTVIDWKVFTNSEINIGESWPTSLQWPLITKSP